MKQKVLMTCLAMLALAACSDNEEIATAQDTLQVNVGMKQAGAENGRAIILGEYLPDGARVGVFFNADATPGTYDGNTYANCCYQATGDKDAQVWDYFQDPANTGSKPVLLSPTIGTAYAYYPYDPTVTSLENIPVHVDNDLPANQNDYMYSSPVTAISMGNRKAYFVMQHALTAVRIYVSKGNYTHIGNVRDIKMTVEGLAKTGTLNAKTGALSNVGQAQLVSKSYTDQFTASAAVHPLDPVIGVPTPTGTGKMTISMTVDGRPYTFSSSNSFTNGKMYSYYIGISEEKLSLQAMTVEPWQTGVDMGGGDVVLPARIQILGNVTDITFHRKDVAGKITLTCVPRYKGRMVIEPDVQTSTVEAKNCVTQQEDKVTGIRTIVIDNPKSAITLNFHGLAPEAPAPVP